MILRLIRKANALALLAEIPVDSAFAPALAAVGER